MFAAIRAEVPGRRPREPGCHPDDGVGRGGTKQSSEQDLETGLEGAVFCRPQDGCGAGRFLFPDVYAWTRYPR